MAKFSDELTAKLKKAHSAEEVTQLLKAEGQNTALAEKIWKELEQLHAQEERELSLDELDAVAGGVKHRNWLEEGCSATVEPFSDCWGTDGGCIYINIEYECMPDINYRCPECGGYVWAHGGANYARVTCPKCGTFYQNWYRSPRIWEKES